MELRGSISSETRRTCPSARNKTAHLLNDFHNELQNLRVEITKVSPTRDLIHLKCHSNDPLFTRALAKDLQGGMACFGYIVEKDAQVQGKGIEGKQPELSIFSCRNVSWNEEQYAFGRTNRREDDVLDAVEMTLTVNRKRFKPTKILVGNQIIFAKLTTFTPYLHIFRALHETSAIPSTLRNFLCDVETSVGENAANAENVDDMFDITPLFEERKTVRNLEAMIDPGCARYLGAIRRSDKLNQSQHIAVMATIASMGDCKVERCSLSMIKGPPGTGKTDCITFLIGALMHHTKYGHVNTRGHRPVDALRNFLGKDSILRHSSNEKSFSFLITSISNSAVDNVMLRIKERGIPGMGDSALRPEMCRIARQHYDLANLSEFSINARALPYDRHIHRPGANQRSASANAVRSYKKECILYFATLTTVAGEGWREHKIPIDVVITDEGAHPFEPEAILPFITTRRHFPNRRMLGVLVGDNNQLVEPSLGLQLIRDHKMSLPFNYELVMTSLFERMFSQKRTTCCMLLTQYRMHPSIANIHFPYFYEDKISNGRLPNAFVDSFNQGPRVNNGYASFTCIDTSLCHERFERKEEGGIYYNDAEISVIDSILCNLYHLVKEDLSRLDGAIEILLPYRFQVDHVTAVLMEHGYFVRFANNKGRAHRRKFDIVIDTCDGMKERERDIVIFAATRSNEEQEIGFLSDRRRLNVAMSRMRKLMVFMGEFSTLKHSQAKYFSHLDRISRNGKQSAHRREWP